MTSIPSPNRREFLSAASLAALGIAAAPGESADSTHPVLPPGFKPGEMKIGCVSWNFRGIGDAFPFDEPIEIVGGMGFDAIELIVSQPGDLDAYWKKESVLSGLQKKLESYKLAVSQFVLFQNAVADLSSLDSDRRNRSLDVFEESCQIAVRLNAPFINMVAPWARELTGPTDYLPRYFAVSKNDKNPKFHIDIAPGFDYAAVWDTFVHTMKGCAERAAHHGIRFSLENHTHTLVHDSTAFLRLWDQVRHPALGMNLDIGWIQLQREYPPFAIHKVKKHLMNLHVRDIDSPGLVFVGIGEGVMDFKAVIETLKTIGYTGYLTFEQDGVPDMRKTLANGKKMIEELIG